PNVSLDTYGKRASKVTTECSIWLRNVVKITDPNKPFYSHRHTVTSYLRNSRLPDGVSRCQRGYRALHSRPCGQGGACWPWQAVVRDTKGRGRSHPEPARRYCKWGANPPIDLILRRTFRLDSGRGDRRVRRRTLFSHPFRIASMVH